jgi:hypothetical protein
MSASDAFESDLLKLIFNNTNIANIGDATGLRGSSSAGSLWVALHVADPGDAGNQSTSESTYTGYARTSVSRSSAAWAVSGTSPTQVTNVSTVAFPQCTGGSTSVSHFSVGSSSSGAGEIIVSGALTASLSVSNGITPTFAASQLTATCD